MELLVVLGLLVALFFLWRARAAGRKAQRGAGRKSGGRFRAVSVDPGEKACMAAFSAEGQRYLLKDAPDLPLPTCDNKECQCRLLPHADRREPGDRRSGLKLVHAELVQEHFSQRAKGRRSSDR